MSIEAEELEYQKILNKILNFAAYSRRTEFEVARKLDSILAKKSPKDQQDNEVDVSPFKQKAVEELKTMGLIDDDKYVKDFTFQSVGSRKHLSKRQIEIFLMKRGISRDLIEKHVSVLNDSDQDFAAAESLVVKKLRQLSKFTPAVQKKKLMVFLAGKGFGFDIIKRVVDTKIKLN